MPFFSRALSSSADGGSVSFLGRAAEREIPPRKAVEILQPPVAARDLALARSRSAGGSRNSGESAGDLSINFGLESYLKQPHEKKK